MASLHFGNSALGPNKNPAFLKGLSVNQARFNYADLQEKEPLLMVPFGQIVLFQFTQFRVASARYAQRISASVRIAFTTSSTDELELLTSNVASLINKVT